ncbi:hypothetical protein PPROV_000532000 [Pycnococcus provasolii]|uniref:Mitochondrial carrier protein n=2 Tax=Pycnococcus provasolii TaxID=41880 RepID=A0A830HII1_9CHLO|nr:hypothetical protein PPROV_000532000 [Pycnococcus provasolii]
MPLPLLHGGSMVVGPLSHGALASFARHLAIGYVAGGTGAAVVYPMDVVKTRMQADTSGRYTSALHCAKQALAEGRLYAGLKAQLIGVAPEKMLKLAAYSAALPVAYDLCGYHGWGPGSDVSIAAEAMAGAVGGFAQVMITCPIEVAKISQQLGGDSCAPYRGLLCTWARDIPSAAIFFAVYAPLYHQLLENGTSVFLASLLAGVVAGVPAAALPTPFDVVKTRVQASGSPFRNGLECLQSILSSTEEAPVAALSAGAGARIARLAPQLGITLSLYSALETNFK